MNLADLYNYVSTEVGWLQLVNFVLIGVIAYLCIQVRYLKKQLEYVWKWCEVTEKLDEDLHKRISKVERH